MHRRSVALGFSLAASGFSSRGFGQDRPGVIIVPYAAGGFADMVARTLAPRLGAELKQTFVIDNVGGGDGTIGLNKFLTVAPDGTTLFLATTEVVHTGIGSGGTLKSLVPVALVATVPVVLLASAKTPIKSFRGMVEVSGKERLKISANSYAEMLIYKRMERNSPRAFEFVSYRGPAPMLNDLMAGEIQLALAAGPAAASAVTSGRAVALATTEPLAWSKETPAFPADVLPAGASIGIYGLYARLGTPNDVVRRLEAAAQRSVQDPKFRQQLGDLGLVARSGTSRELTNAIQTVAALLPDPCKVSSECEKDPTCPKPCP